MTKEKTLFTFKDGYRVLLLIHRSKDGGSNRPDYHSVKRLSKNPKEFDKVFSDLKKLKEKSEIPYRLYSTVNPRDIHKAIRLFKFKQLEADYYDNESHIGFYTDIKNRWFGCLMNPKAKMGSNFIIDVDSTDPIGKEDARNILLEQGISLLAEYPTLNGFHFVTEPYNPSLTPQLEIKKDALVFWE